MAALAVSGCVALSGCVAVEPRPAPPPPPPNDRPAQVVEPQIVQSPAREVLEPPATPTPAAAGPGERPRPRPPEPGAAEPPARPHRKPERPGRPERPVKPAAPAPVVRPDVCALGEGYGRWRPGSPEARICREVHGN
ncbi:hypothetical protein [Streptomyces sp. NPDC005408]|uniref:hypothetical protein n=1 Tax=Streptomyces sp. NPDC005408 TaxID=3155341 RepID=UPI00339E1586